MKTIITDVGNALIKGLLYYKDEELINTDEAAEDAIEINSHKYYRGLHALAPVSKSEYAAIVQSTSGNVPNAYLMTGDKRYVVGESAQGQYYGDTIKSLRANRYTAEYYGVLVSHVVTQLLPPQRRKHKIRLIVGYPPGDYQYRDNLKMAIPEEILVSRGNKTWKVDVAELYVYEEPLGGYFNNALLSRSTYSQIADGRTLIVDIGGTTTDTLGIQDGQIQFNTYSSSNIGANVALSKFEKMLRFEHKDVFSSGTPIDLMRLMQALDTCVWSGGGYKIDCEAICNSVKYDFAAAVATLVNGVSLSEYDHVLLIGGSIALIGETLSKMINHGNVLLDANINPEFSNIEGIGKFYDYELEII